MIKIIIYQITDESNMFDSFSGCIGTRHVNRHEIYCLLNYNILVI